MNRASLRERRRQVVFLAVLLLALAAVYGPALPGEPIYDSRVLFTRGLLFIQDFPPLAAFSHGFFAGAGLTMGSGAYYRPLVTLSFMLEKKVWGLESWKLRLINLIVFAVALALIYRLLRRQESGPWFAESVVALFAFFPTQLHSVAWEVGRCDLFLLLWGAAAWLALDAFIRSGRKLWLAVAWGSFVLGVFSKEAFIFFLPVLWLYELSRRRKTSWFFHAALLASAVIFLLIRSRVLGTVVAKIVAAGGVWDQLQMILATTGFYCQCLFVPFGNKIFLPLAETVTFGNLIAGLLFLLLLAFLVVRHLKYRELWSPLALTLIFLGGHVVLVLTPLYPFRASARFIMIPLLGLLWILFWHLRRGKMRAWTAGATGIAAVLFAVQLLANSGIYRSESAFWEELHRSYPQDMFITVHYSQLLFEDRSYLDVERMLRSLEGRRISPQTAVQVALLNAQLEMVRAHFSKVDYWLGRLGSFHLFPADRWRLNQLRVKSALARGRLEQAEALSQQAIAEFQRPESYWQLYDLYMGFGRWSQAQRLAFEMKRRFPRLAAPDPEYERRQFVKLPVEAKVKIHMERGQIAAALDLCLRELAPGLGRDLLLIKLYLWSGREEDARRLAAEARQRSQNDFRTLNALGFLYLRELARLSDALVFFAESLRLQPSQQSLARLINVLKRDYAAPPPAAPFPAQR